MSTEQTVMFDRPSKDEYFMGFARHAATRSKDTTKVGACLVGPAGEVRLTGYNGPPIGVHDLPKRFERPQKYLFASHAEANVIAFAARQGIRTEGCTLYVTHHPCAACTRTIIQAGIVEIVYGPGKFMALAEEITAASDMLSEAGVKVRFFNPPDRMGWLETEYIRLRALLDTRPAINAEMPERYIEWSRAVYRSDAEAFGKGMYVRSHEKESHSV
jgi:dCMP deaminase